MPPRIVTSRPRTLTKARCAAARRIPRLNQNYHSYEHDSSPAYTAEEDVILAAAIHHVPTHGFTSTALSSGIRDAGYPDVAANLFPDGVFSLVKYHLVTERLALSKNTPTPASPASGGVLDMVRHLTLQRLHANKPIIHRWQEALAILAMPKHFAPSLYELALLSDEIHFLAGDKSVDTSWYTKRAGLSAIYASTELFMTQDKSPNFKETEDFFDRRLEAAQSLRRTVGDAGQWAGVQAMGIISALRSKGVRV
ncbi:MAG: hypothetical protein L6R42_003975 [Xanthoria sp. 1 TBL-2021]|nr:MAG: hypothetical protein L6R42_003975 [Xanthoria sp. 1 TBL-2021]